MQPFWGDLARHLLKTRAFTKFLSEGFIYSLGSSAEFLSYLALMDLSFESGHYEISALEGGFIEYRVKPAQNVIIFLKTFEESQSLQNTRL